MKIDFLGARYYSQKLGQEHQTFGCQRGMYPKRAEFQTDYRSFYKKIRPRIQKENPGIGHHEILHLVGLEWRKQPLTEKCSGKVKFKVANGKARVNANGLMAYVEHSKKLSIGID